MHFDQSVTDAVLRVIQAASAAQNPRQPGGNSAMVREAMPTFNHVSGLTRSHQGDPTDRSTGNASRLSGHTDQRSSGADIGLSNLSSSSGVNSPNHHNSMEGGFHAHTSPGSSVVGQKRKLILPTMFQSKKSKSKPVKSTRYLRDIFCLPKECQSEDGNIAIPRGSRRSSLANPEVGLFGKIEFESTWSPKRIKGEISTVFAKPFGLTEDDITNGKLISFDYLQRTGAGSRTLCIPAVSSKFEWNGRQVATLAKSGGIIYILAKDDISALLIEDEEASDDGGGLPQSKNQSDTPPPIQSPHLSPDIPSRLPSPRLRVDDILSSPSSSLLSFEGDESPTFQDIGEDLRDRDCCTTRSSPICIDDEETPSVDQQSSVVINSMQYSPASEGSGENVHVEKLMSIYEGHLTKDQILAVYEGSGKCFDESMNCLGVGPTLDSILDMLNQRMRQAERDRIEIDPDELWQDFLVYYKSPSLNMDKQLRVKLENSPAVDTGGVRRELYTTVFKQFIDNKHVKLFDGPSHKVRPACTAESRSSGLFKILGKMVGHSICQDGIGFPYFSIPCYWYMAKDEEKATEVSTVEDIGANITHVVSQLQGVSTESDAIEVMRNEQVVSVFEKCGITTTLSPSTKDVIAQEIITHDAFFKSSKLLDQFCEGLKCTPVYKLMFAFPHHFLPLFTYSGDIRAEDVVAALILPARDSLSPTDCTVLDFFQRYIFECNAKGLNEFLFHITGKLTVSPKSIKVQFASNDEHGVIATHICSNQIVFPHGLFTTDLPKEEAYGLFCTIMKTVICDSTYNMV